MSLTVGELQVLLSGDPRPLNRNLDALDARAGKTEQIHTSAWKRVAVTAGAAIAAIGIGAFVTDTVRLGNQYTGALNNVQAVTGATAAQMTKVRETSRALGSDLTLPATSAYDAASAMEELAKGGLSVDSAMKAAKGTLTLSAAAQIDAATAAGIQANALNTFSLSADQANRVADVLANTANAASGEITDFAAGLQQSGTVAHLFGISLEDTAAALGIFANAGIKGSDAGTSLKTALTALTSPTLAQQKAMDQLGLSVYDAQGNFVGLSKLSGQLHDAQGRLTDQQFQAAAATIFGTDAIRAAALMAQTGSEGFDAMAAAVGKQGGAADLAAAKTKGLGGAIDGLKSQFETFQIDLYERASPNIEKLVRYAAEHLPEIADAVLDGVDTAIGWLGKLKDGAVTAFQAISKYLSPVTSELNDLWDSLTAAKGPAQAAWGALKAGGAILVGLADAAHPVVELGGQMLRLFNSLPGPVQTAVLALGALKIATSFDFFGRLAGSEGRVRSSLGTSAQSVAGFAQTVRMNMRLAGDEVGGLTKLTGGLSAGFQTYLPNASRQVQNFGQTVGSAFQQAKQLQRFKVADMFGTGSLSKSTGDLAGFNGALKNVASQGMGGLKSAGSGLVNFLGGPWGVALAGAGLAVSLFTSIQQQAEQTGQGWAQAMREGGEAAQDAAREMQAAGSRIDDTFGTLGGKLKLFWNAAFNPSGNLGVHEDIAALGEAGQAAEDYWKSLSPVEQAQAKVSEWTGTLSSRLQDENASASDVEAAQRRLAYWTEQTRIRQEELDTATQSATGALQAQTAAAMAGANADLAKAQADLQLKQTMDQYAEAMNRGVLTGDDLTASQLNVTNAAIGAAQAAGQAAYAHSQAATDEGKQADADAALLKSLQATARQLGVNTPAAITNLIGSLQASAGQGATSAAQMRDLGLSVREIPGQRFVQIDAPTADQKRRMEDLGLVVRTLPDGHVYVFANTADANAAMRNFVNQRRSITINVRAVMPDLNGAVSGSGRMGTFASGGQMPARRLSLVGEQGPELMFPDRSAWVATTEQTNRILAGLAASGQQASSLFAPTVMPDYGRMAGAAFLPTTGAALMASAAPGNTVAATGTGAASVRGVTQKHYHLHSAVTQAITPREFVNLQREADALYG